jgi:hypothetical protein
MEKHRPVRAGMAAFVAAFAVAGLGSTVALADQASPGARDIQCNINGDRQTNHDIYPMNVHTDPDPSTGVKDEIPGGKQFCAGRTASGPNTSVWFHVYNIDGRPADGWTSYDANGTEPGAVS